MATKTRSRLFGPIKKIQISHSSRRPPVGLDLGVLGLLLVNRERGRGGDGDEAGTGYRDRPGDGVLLRWRVAGGPRGDHRRRPRQQHHAVVYVAFDGTDRLIGNAAKKQVVLNPDNTVFDVKRLIGRRFSDPSVQSNIKQWPFKVIAGPGHRPMITVNYKGKEKQFTPEEISSMLLTKMKEITEAHLGCSISKAVVTVPAHFNGSQRQATMDACAMAGLHGMHIINEPTAVAMAYLHSQKARSRSNSSRTMEKKNVPIFNLGARNLDVSLVTVNGGVLMVKATAGADLGGDDFDDGMVDYYIKEFKHRHNNDISRNRQALRRLRMATSELAKRRLSSTMQTTVQIDSLYEGMDFYTTLTRGRFNEVNKDLYSRCLETVEKCLRGAMVDRSSVRDIVLAGSSTRMPKVRKMLEDFFDAEHVVESGVNNPNEATAFGHIVENVNPEEAAACGAAVQAAILSGEASLEERCRLVHDVTSLSLGVGTGSSRSVTLLFPWNTTLPAAVRKLNVFTDSENQTEILLPVYEGEGLMTEDKVLLGEVQASGFSPGPPGTQITLCFDIDMNGILNVSAEHMKQNKITAVVRKDKG